MSEVADTTQLTAREYLSRIGRKGGEIGGKSISWKKSCAARRNGAKPCRPGKKRGRPTKQKEAA